MSFTHQDHSHSGNHNTAVFNNYILLYTSFLKFKNSLLNIIFSSHPYNMSWSKEEIYWQFSDKIQPLMISFLRKCYFTYQLMLIFILRCNLSTDPLLNAPNILNRHSKRFNKIQLFPSFRSTKNKVSIFSNHILSRYREKAYYVYQMRKENLNFTND